MKKIFSVMSAASLSLALLTGNAFAAETTSTKASASIDYSTASDEVIKQKLIEIADKYDINEVIEGKDLEFIKTYGNRVISVTPKTNGNKVQAKAVTDTVKTHKVKGAADNDVFAGSIKGTLETALGIWQNTIEGDITTKVTSGTPDYYKTDVRIVGYGLVGTSGTYIGKTVDETYSSGWQKSKKKSWTYTLDRVFYGSVAFLTIDVVAAVSGEDGELEITSD
ncbi:hypothetical protein [Brevibacillus agri]|uniref:hypothetical protein n=1 Tax=Brevibacillus agri TaxID=51101 RepID=UPI0030F4AAE7